MAVPSTLSPTATATAKSGLELLADGLELLVETVNTAKSRGGQSQSQNHQPVLVSKQQAAKVAPRKRGGKGAHKTKSISVTGGEWAAMVGYRPARGRARAKQLAAMTPQQIDAEKAARLERNRLCARECRQRKKGRDNENQQIIDELRAEVADQAATIGKLK
eukprot:gene19279-9169_t